MQKRSFQKYGPAKEVTYKKSKKEGWQYELAKRMSSYPVIKWLLNPMWSSKRFEVNVIPINVEIKSQENVSVPRRVMEKIIDKAGQIFVMDRCYCRDFIGEKKNADIGCMAFGATTKQIHPSHGRFITKEEAYIHVGKAAKQGLVANMAWVWVDTHMWGIEPLDQLLFTCFCEDHCLYRANMKKRGPNLNKNNKRLPGVTMAVDPSKCKGCATCVDNCYVAEMKIIDGMAVQGEDCKACGKCYEYCPSEAISIKFDDQNSVFDRLWKSVSLKTTIG